MWQYRTSVLIVLQCVCVCVCVLRHVFKLSYVACSCAWIQHSPKEQHVISTPSVCWLSITSTSAMTCRCHNMVPLQSSRVHCSLYIHMYYICTSYLVCVTPSQLLLYTPMIVMKWAVIYHDTVLYDSTMYITHFPKKACKSRDRAEIDCRVVCIQ